MRRALSQSPNIFATNRLPVNIPFQNFSKSIGYGLLSYAFQNQAIISLHILSRSSSSLKASLKSPINGYILPKVIVFYQTLNLAIRIALSDLAKRSLINNTNIHRPEHSRFPLKHPVHGPTISSTTTTPSAESSALALEHDFNLLSSTTNITT